MCQFFFCIGARRRGTCNACERVGNQKVLHQPHSNHLGKGVVAEEFQLQSLRVSGFSAENVIENDLY